MSETTGVVLTIGAITMANESVFNNEPINWKVPIATGISAMMLSLLERASPILAKGLAWLSLVTLLFARLDPKIPAPMESLQRWLGGTQ